MADQYDVNSRYEDEDVLTDHLNNATTYVNEQIKDVDVDISGKADKTYVDERLSENVKYPIASFEISSEVVRKDRPYFHVERYGAKADYNFTTLTGTDNTPFVQRAIDTALRAEGGVVQFGYGHYKIESTVYINTPSGNFPITIEGMVTGQYRGTNIWKETTGDLFRTNLTSENVSFMEPLAQFYHFKVQDISFNSNTKVAGAAFHMFRTRVRMNNVSFFGFERSVFQETADANGNANYCDMSDYKNISINYPRLGGLELNKPDGSTISNIYVHNPEPTCTNYILVRNGGGFSISNCVFAFHFANDGVSISNTNAYIKFSGIDGAEITNLYVERTHMSSMIYVNDSKNIKIDGVYERFLGNNLLHSSNSHNVEIKRIYRHAAKNVGYCDIYFSNTNTGVNISQFRIRDYNTAAKRELDLQGVLPSDLKGEIVQIGVYYDGAVWKVVDFLGNDISSILGVPVWTNNDGTQFPDTSLVRYGTILSPPQPRYAGATVIPYTPVINVPSTRRIAFYDATGRVQTVSTNMNCMLVMSLPMSV